MVDKIAVTGMRFYGYHGALPEEKKIGQRFFVDVWLSVDLYGAGTSDSLSQTINYAKIYGLVRDVVEGPSFKLIEAVAEKVAKVLLNAFPRAEVCHVRVVKPDPPIAGHYDSVSVEIERRRSSVYIGLGSNVGDRALFLKRALEKMDVAANITVVRCSSIYETDPYGPVQQDDFLNMAVLVETLLPPMALLMEIQQIEAELQRKREIHWGPRTIDLDILLYNQDAIDMEKLSVPHPEMARRAFVLRPLFEIAPHLVVPGVNRSVTDLWQNLDQKGGVRLWKANNGEGEFGLFVN
ncbi:2-amino-4-hydroxy-6-hydroxymethyldihydropteridine diphosphokinase [Sporolactobacillus sp. CQH2019]|uniref:2-amino-4-hydroxy-6- hydroxymethyldihydropteridine diphosphokinase n=1 Tax=Sporolactobacillus sp. CQH2019 TaxID=3023512 RepID=UPI0023679E24|nr:2-amino-4-hydroxy-6-hydroxymethyldihydropteridine diphosphokinase [Sporolactobacillus sp. CQH2019]MDD9150714.1 2-amino-4-hydroxy-6-hydroxymethyldihydropteridine diphosphokinase [Sporolactobacillus sp. CQH2019]